MTHSAPTGASKKEDDAFSVQLKDLGKGRSQVSIRVIPVGPEYEQGAADDMIAREKPEVAAVGAVISIVAHGKVEILGNGLRTIVVALVPASLVKATSVGVNVGIGVHFVGLIQRLPFDVNGLVANLQGLSGKADDSLDVENLGVPWVFEDDDISSLQGVVRGEGKADLETVPNGEFIDEQTITNQNGGFHGGCGHGHGMHHVSRDKESEDGTHDRGHKILAQYTVLLRILGGGLLFRVLWFLHSFLILALEGPQPEDRLKFKIPNSKYQIPNLI